MTRLLRILPLAILVVGCGPSEGPSGQTGCKNQTPRSQALSQPCCQEWGVDACGATLFCAAFDGRTQATCYPERSRADRTECTEDRQCTSGSCNLAAGRCRSTPYTACEAAIGCASDPAGKRYACDGSKSPAQCVQMGNGTTGAVCEAGADCQSGTCTDFRCKGKLGQSCDVDTDCVEGHCAMCGYSNVFCSSPSDSRECLKACPSGGGWSTDFKVSCP